MVKTKRISMDNYHKEMEKSKVSNKEGILLMIMAAFFFALMAFVIKLLDDIPLMEIVLFRNIPSMIIIPIIILMKKDTPILGKNKPFLFLRGIFGALGVTAMFYTYTTMSITDSTAIQRLSPFFIIIMSIVFLKERYNFKQTPFILLAFIGALFVIKPGFRTDILPAIVALVSALLMGAAHIVIRHLRLSDNYWVIINYYAYITGFSAIILLLWQGNFVIPDLRNFILLIIIGLSAIGTQIGITLSYRFSPACVVAPYLYAQIIFAAILEITFLGVIPDPMSIIGSIMIIISGILHFKCSKNTG